VRFKEIAYGLGRHQDCLRRGRGIRRPRDGHRLQQGDPGELAIATDGCGAGETEPRRGRQIDISASIDLSRVRLDAARLRPAALVLRVGNASEFQCRLCAPVCDAERLPPRDFWNSLIAATMRSLTSPVMAPLYCPTQARSDCSASCFACAIAFAVSSGFCGAGRIGTVVTTFGLAPAVAGGVI
jgi:hypothetical protein